MQQTIASSTLRSAIAQARADWPGFFVEEEVFLEYVQARLPSGVELEAVLPELHLSDLYCACACALGNPRAVATFEERYVRPAGKALSTLGEDAEFAAEVTQLLRHKILLPRDSQPPRIADYAGRGPLLGWVRASLLRVALNRKRDRKRDRCATAAPLAETSRMLSDPELGYIRREHRELLKVEFERAFLALDRRARNILRLYLLEGMNIERIGVLYHVHRATIARWIQQARQELAEGVRLRLRERTDLNGAELDSFLGALPSQLDLSISRWLRDSNPGSTAESMAGVDIRPSPK